MLGIQKKKRSWEETELEVSEKDLESHWGVINE